MAGSKGKRNVFCDECTLPAQEGSATASVRPGALVALSAAGVTESAELGTVFGTEALFADRDMLRATDSDTPITVGEVVIARQLETGKIANVLAVAAVYASCGIGLASNADGTLKTAATDGTEKIIAYTDEIITLAGVDFLRVRGA